MHRIVAAIAVVLSMGFGAAEDPTAPKGSLRQLRFSPDGQYVIAQDDKTINVLTVKPFSVLFRIPTEDAAIADFTPDSRQVLFLRSRVYMDSRQMRIRASPARVERWSVAGGARVGTTEIIIPDCGTVGLSPDGSFLACDDVNGVFRLFEVSFKETILTRKHFGQRAITRGISECQHCPTEDVTVDGKLGSALITFSPDGRFLVAIPERSNDADGFAWDCQQAKTLELKAALRRLRWSLEGFYLIAPPFTFVASDRAVVSFQTAWNPKDTTVTATLALFPSGKVLLKARIPPGPLFRAADPGFVIVRPCGKSAACAVEYTTGQMIVSETPALDVLGRYYVAEKAIGEVGLYERGKGLQTTVSLGTR
jgi:WD40 repeat protein